MAITETEMNFIKSNIIPIICAVVVLLAIGAMFYPIGKNEGTRIRKLKQRK